MHTKKMSQEQTVKLVMGAILTAIVIVLQFVGSAIKFGPFSISLVLLPIIIGAAMCNEWISAWLGLVFGIIVLASGDAAPFMEISIPGTIATVLLKGSLAGLGAGFIYKLLSKKNMYLAVVLSALACPVINTGIFLLGCRFFFYETISQWGAGNGFESTAAYMFLGLVGVNFLVELGVNIVLSPVVVRILRIKFK